MSGISITCFAASYAVALALEVSRLFFRSGVRGAIMLGFGVAGVVAQTLFLVYRAWTTPGIPLSSEFDWFLLAAWVLAGLYLYLTVYHPRAAVGLFVLPLVLGLVAVAATIASPAPFPKSLAVQRWGLAHACLWLLGSVAIMVGFVAGSMLLVHVYQLKHKLLPRRGFQLPSLEWLERVSSRAILVSAILLSLGYLSGTVLNLVGQGDTSSDVPWSDPVVWSSSLLFVWLLVASAFTIIYKPARKGRKIAYLTVTSFVLLVLAICMQFLFSSRHGPSSSGSTSRSSSGSTSRSSSGSTVRMNLERRAVRPTFPIAADTSAARIGSRHLRAFAPRRHDET